MASLGSVANPRAGTLTMYLDKETYERAGLVGMPYGPKGNRGLKPRWSTFPFVYLGPFPPIRMLILFSLYSCHIQPQKRHNGTWQEGV